MTRITRRDFIQQSAGAAIAAAALGGAESAVAQQWKRDVYYYDGILPSILAEKIGVDKLKNFGFTGFIFPGGDVGADLGRLKDYISPAKKLMDANFKVFFCINIGSVHGRLADWRKKTESYIKEYTDQCSNINPTPFTGLCLDMEGDAWRNAEWDTCHDPIYPQTDPQWYRAWGEGISALFFLKRPMGELLILHASPWDDPGDVRYQPDAKRCPSKFVTESVDVRWGRWKDFFTGVLNGLSLNGSRGKVTLLSEGTYGPNEGQIDQGFIGQHLTNICADMETAVTNIAAKNEWKKSNCRVGLGFWPLGVSCPCTASPLPCPGICPDRPQPCPTNNEMQNWTCQEIQKAKQCDKTSPYTFARELRKVSELTRDTNVSKKPILWIYGQNSAWMPEISPCTTLGSCSKGGFTSDTYNSGSQPTGIGGSQNTRAPYMYIDKYYYEIRNYRDGKY